MQTKILIILTLLSLTFSYPTVSIIGSGIGGSACSYYLKEFGNITQVDIFETNDYIGGRVKEVLFAGSILELGASEWSIYNFYIEEIVQKLNIEKERSFSNATLGIWSKNGFVNEKLLYVLNSDTNECVHSQINKVASEFEYKYLEREINGPFNSIEQFLGNMTHLTNISFSEFLNPCNASEKYKIDLLSPYTMITYEQDLNLQSFAGSVVFISILDRVYKAKLGNSQIPKQMVNYSEANVHLNTKINTIEWNDLGQNYILSSDNQSYTTDYVVIAAPIEKTGIEFIGINPNITERTYVSMYVTCVEAEDVNAEYFGLESVPDDILATSTSKLPFLSLMYANESINAGYKIYGVTSKNDVTGILDDIFINIKDYYVHHWPYTFPELVETDTFQPIMLGKNIWYLNTIESAASAMEMSVIAGRNVAELILDEFL